MPDNSEILEGIKEGQEISKSENLEITEIHCHECDGYIKFALDKDKSGEHVVICPKCGHEHCRIIKDGVVTGDRWASRNVDKPALTAVSGQPVPVMPTYIIQVSSDNYSLNGWQVTQPGGGNDPFLTNAWGTSGGQGQQIIDGTCYTYLCVILLSVVVTASV